MVVSEQLVGHWLLVHVASQFHAVICTKISGCDAEVISPSTGETFSVIAVNILGVGPTVAEPAIGMFNG